jgi:hypothetical protein
VLDAAGQVVLERRVRTSRDRFAALIGTRPPARVLLDASTGSKWVAQALEAPGHEVVVADPNFDLRVQIVVYVLVELGVFEALFVRPYRSDRQCDRADAFWHCDQHCSNDLGNLPRRRADHSKPEKEGSMPRQKTLMTIIRDLVQQEVRSAIQSLLGSVSTAKRAKNGRRRRRRRRGSGRPPGSKTKAA